jgi:hypothetical protein
VIFEFLYNYQDTCRLHNFILGNVCLPDRPAFFAFVHCLFALMFLIKVCSSCDSTRMRVHSHESSRHNHIPVEGLSKFICPSVHMNKLKNCVTDVNGI